MHTTSPLLIRAVALKVASRCNINCRYCYIYNMGDETYKQQPRFMEETIYTSAVGKIRDYCLRHGIDSFSIHLFGGEPLLAGKKRISEIVETANRILRPDVSPEFFLQTNGILLDDEWCDLFARYNINVGVSLDGDEAANDLNRVDHQGAGTYKKVVAGLKCLADSSVMKNIGKIVGTKSVVDIDTDPVAIYRHFKTLGIPYIDFLIPDANYVQLPKGIDTPRPTLSRNSTPYADWLISLFDEWFDDDEPKPAIQLFKFMIRSILGGKIIYDYVGDERSELLIIETNGDVEASDDLKACGNGFTKSACNILRNELDDAFSTPLAVMYNLGKLRLARQCLACPVREVCGGGYLPTRYDSSNGFNNPSVYCKDLLKLITHIRKRVIGEFPEDQLREFGITPITFDETVSAIQENIQLVEEPEYLSDLEYFKN